MSKLTWKEILNAHTDKRSEMKAPALVGVIVALHLSVMGAFVFIQGCGTNQPVKPAVVERPPAPAMPPRADAPTRPASMPPPSYQPPTMTPAPAPVPTADAKSYVVQKGDSLSRIARQAGISTRELAAINQIDNPNKIRVGQSLMLPPTASVPATSSPTPVASRSSRSSSSSSVEPIETDGTYVVQKGDLLSTIAKRYGVTAKQLAAANGIDNPDMIRVGQTLKVPTNGGNASPRTSSSMTPRAPAAPTAAPTTPTAPAVPAPAAPVMPMDEPLDLAGSYELTVRPGQSLQSLARDNAVTVDSIRDANDMEPGDEVFVGQTILIPLEQP